VVSGLGKVTSTPAGLVAGEISFAVFVDGNPVGFSYVYTNELSSHKTTVPDFVYLGTYPAGTHAFNIQRDYGSSDANDNWSATSSNSRTNQCRLVTRAVAESLGPARGHVP
jgi:hypothetical protein